MVIKFNLSYEADPEIAKWFSNADFRRALVAGHRPRPDQRDVLARHRHAGLGRARATSTSTAPGREYRTMWATLDVKKANEMLDKIGLDKKDAEGYRLRTDGKGRLRIEIMTLRRPVRAVHADRRDDPRAVEEDRHRPDRPGGRAQPRASSGTPPTSTSSCAWNNDGSEHLFTFPAHVFPFDATRSALGPLYAQVVPVDGAQGKEPPSRRCAS